jgi:hypothetical protein
MRYLVWIALALLGLILLRVGTITATRGWTPGSYTAGLAEVHYTQRRAYAVPVAPEAGGGIQAVLAAADAAYLATILPASARADGATIQPPAPLAGFSRGIVFLWVLGLLMPLWSLCFAVNAVGGEREGRTLVWLLGRPLPRPAAYLALFVGVLPWSLGLNLAAFALLCLAGGRPGREALFLYWPGVVGGTLAYTALFQFIGAAFRRPAVVALVYAFFLEPIVALIPGYPKRFSVTFYARCLMYEAAEGVGWSPAQSNVWLPVSGPVAWAALLGITAGLLVAGMWWFSRSEYPEEV